MASYISDCFINLSSPSMAEYPLRRICTMNLFVFISGVLFTVLVSSCGAPLNLGLSATVEVERETNEWCQSWRLSVETHNARDWKSVPEECVEYVAHYIKDGQYHKDFQLVISQARDYLHSGQVQPVGDGKDAWIFDVDETALSNLGYYEQMDFGGAPHNRTKYFAWVMEEKATALEATLSLYNELRAMGFGIFFITGRRWTYRDVTASNLLHEGYKNCSGLLMREPDDEPGNVRSLKITKRAELEKQGYKIWGNMGDQWSDLLGHPEGFRTFKLPNPMYYVG